MRLLYFALDYPWPPNNGLRLRTWTLLRALYAEGCSVTLVCLQMTASMDSPQPLHELCDSVWMLDRRPPSLSRGVHAGGRLAALLARQPYAAWRFRAEEARALLQRLWSGAAWDAVICDTVYAAVDIPAGAGPLVVNHHNIEHRIYSTYAAHEPRRWRRAAARWEGKRVERWESVIGRRTQLNLVCSQVDRDHLLAQQPQARVLVVPNIAPELAGEPSAPTEPGLVVFQGALDWLPNRDAVDYFLREIWPLVLRGHPQARLQVVGRHPPPAFLARHRAQPRVQFAADVADIRPYLERAAVAIAPLRMGSGTRLKILEAAAMGKAIVATPLGAEGLNFIPGMEILLGSSAAGFAVQLVRLLRSPDLARALGERARRRVEASYSPAALRHSLREALRQLQPAPPAAAGPVPTGSASAPACPAA
ncbi:MAG: glycosyltransferase family 4 protein [Terriglobales bacterium]